MHVQARPAAAVLVALDQAGVVEAPVPPGMNRPGGDRPRVVALHDPAAAGVLPVQQRMGRVGLNVELEGSQVTPEGVINDRDCSGYSAFAEHGQPAPFKVEVFEQDTRESRATPFGAKVRSCPCG